MANAHHIVEGYLKNLQARRAYQWRLAVVLVCLSLLVVGGTAWALHLTGESKTIDTSESETIDISVSDLAPLATTSVGYADDGTTYTKVEGAEAVSSFYLWIYSDTTGTTKVADHGKWDDTTKTFDDSTAITDALTYSETANGTTQTYYLIPIKYFTDVASSLTGFTFDTATTNPGTCPFVYAPNAGDTSAKNDATYVYVESTDSTAESGWYVQVQDTGSYGDNAPPRSNVYYSPSNSFTLIYNGSTVTFSVVDESGNPIYGDYSSYNITANGSERFIFGKADSSSLTEDTTKYTIKESIAPTIAGYTYSSATYSTHTVYSVGTGGYNNTIGGSVTTFRFYGTEPLTASQYYTENNTGDYKVTLVYSVATTDTFTMTYGDTTITFNLVDDKGNTLGAVCSDITAQAGMRYIFGPPSVESHEENERGTNKDKVVWNIAPSVDGYAYHSATWKKTTDNTTDETIDETAGETVCSIATAGYVDSLSDSGDISHLRFYSTEGITSNGYTDITEAGSYTVTLVYRTAVNSFTLTLQDGDTEIATLNVYIVDLSGNPISGDYSDYSATLEKNRKYLFEADGSDSNATQLTFPEYISDNGSDYAYYETRYKSNFPVVSVVTQGYGVTNSDGSAGTLGSAFRFYQSGGTDANGGYYTYQESDNDGKNVYLVYAQDMHVVTEVANANSTAVNLFDYWCTTQDGSDYHQNADDEGINDGHALKFHFSSSDNVGTFNKWTGSSGGVLQGIVSGTLTKGFPTLSGDTNLGMTAGGTESLNYLFDPTVPVPDDANETGTSYKASYRNVQGLFQINSNGYYYYNAKENFAEFDEDTNRFTLYEEAGVANSDTTETGMFFPFNTIQEAYPLNSGENATLNHYFGMALTTRFIQNYEGYTDSSHETSTSFRFAGDDDVWIFIDDVLVADLGGIHDATGVTIDFAKGTVTVNTVYGAESNPVTTSFSNIFANTDVKLEEHATKNADGTEVKYTTLADGTTHTLKFFYLERGNAASNLYLEYNLTEVPDTSIYKVDQYGDPLEGATFAVYPVDYTATTASSEGTETDESGNIGGNEETVETNEVTETTEETETTESSGTADGEVKYKVTTVNGVDPETATYINLADYTQVYNTNDLTTATGGAYYIHPADGVITAKVGETTYTITPAYLGTTDSDGEMPFVDNDGMSYSAAELKSMFGEYFILREVDVPDGYRTVEDEILLMFEGELLQSVDPYGTGVWASPNALVTATNTLYVADGYDHTNDGLATGSAIDYYNPTTGETNGTLFAVVLKRNTGDEAIITTADVPSWQPVYGSDDKGYNVLSFGGEGGAYKTQLEAVIAAAKLADDYGNVEFGYAASGMQVLLKNLPGEATRYYTYMLNNGGTDKFTETDPQYLIAYYYTTAGNLDGATVGNTVRIRSHGQTATSEDSTTYDAFTLQWGADIEVPNIENRLFFQKQDASGGFVENAVFALYPVEELQTTTVEGVTTANYYYTATASDNTKAYVRLDTSGVGTALVYTTSGGDPTAGTYTIQTDKITIPETDGTGYITDAGAGYITVTTSDGTYTIKPATNAAGTSMVGYTHDDCDFVSEDGTGHFKQLTNGYYILREIAAPAGYAVNPEEIKVLVDDTSVYANAGTTTNGVAVGNGVGYLVRTLDVFASEGVIDESLTWVFSMLRVSNNNDTFSGVDISNNPNYVKQDPGEANGYGSNIAETRSDAMVTYLKYVGNNEETNVLFDYAVNDATDDDGENIGQAARKGTTSTESGDSTNNDSNNASSNDETNSASESDASTDGSQNILYGELGDEGFETLAGEGTLRLYTTAGWSALEVYQDHVYGSTQSTTNAGDNTSAATTNYSDLSGRNLTNLFSNSTFVRVTDEYSTGNLEISKTVLPTPTVETTFAFTLTLSAGEEMLTTLVGSYNYTIYDVSTVNGVETRTESSTGTITITTTTNDEGSITSQSGSAEIQLKDNQVVVIEGLPYGTEYSVKETLPNQENALPYVTWISVNDGTSIEDTTTKGTLLWEEALNEDNVWTVDYTNALLPLVNIVKVDGSNDGTTKLAGAVFVMYREITTGEGDNAVTETQYYNSSDGKWYALSDGKTEGDYAMTTGDNGELMVANMNRAGTYYLKELVAPNGYNLLTEKIEFEVGEDDKGDLVIKSPTTESSSNIYSAELSDDGQELEMTVKNTAGIELPKTGGIGTTIFYVVGGILVVAAAALLITKRRRG